MEKFIREWEGFNQHAERYLQFVIKVAGSFFVACCLLSAVLFVATTDDDTVAAATANRKAALAETVGLPSIPIHLSMRGDDYTAPAHKMSAMTQDVYETARPAIWRSSGLALAILGGLAWVWLRIYVAKMEKREKK